MVFLSQQFFHSLLHKVAMNQLVPDELECPLRVISGHSATTLRMSAFGGKADINHPLAFQYLLQKFLRRLSLWRKATPIPPFALLRGLEGHKLYSGAEVICPP